MKLKIIKGDITKFEGDAIVNSANTSLTATGGLTAAVFKAAGPELRRECAAHKHPITGNCCEIGDFCITGGYRLPAKRIVHAVGPKWRGGAYGEEDELRTLYERIMNHAVHVDIRSIAFPSLSSGHHGFPIHVVAEVSVFAIGRFLRHYPEMSATIYAYTDEDYEAYQKAFVAAKRVIVDMPEWIVHVTGPFNGEGTASARDLAVFECRHAGKIGKFTSEYWLDNFPGFELKTTINDVDFSVGHKHSLMAMAGGIRADGNIVYRYMPNQIRFQVWLNGKPWKWLVREEIQKLLGMAELEFWVTDPRFLFAAYAALCEKKSAVSKILSIKPSRYLAAEILDRYDLRLSPCNFGNVSSEALDCYQSMRRLYDDMARHGKDFVKGDC